MWIENIVSLKLPYIVGTTVHHRKPLQSNNLIVKSVYQVSQLWNVIKPPITTSLTVGRVEWLFTFPPLPHTHTKIAFCFYSLLFILQESGQDDSKSSSSSSINESPKQQTSTTVNATPAKCTSPEKVVKLFYPEYVLHTDTELEQVRQQYFELWKKGEERSCKMSKELRCRLIRNTMTSMIAILRAKGDGESHRYPSKPEITAMAKRIVQYYPMLQDQGIKNTWVSEMHPLQYQSVSCWTF